MYVPYNILPDNSRVWIYQSNREFTESEKSLIADKTIGFIEQWTRHGENVKGSFEILYNRFLIIAVDQDFVEVSGCSIDASVKLVQQIQAEFNVDMLNKLSIAFKKEDKIEIASLAQFTALAKSKEIDVNTVVFNNMIDTKKGVETQWEVSAKQSWHTRFFN